MHNAITSPRVSYPLVDIDLTAKFILSVQKQNGEIPWSEGGKTDHWDHIESAMGLSVSGYLAEAQKAYLWSSKTQLSDGSWWSYYKDGKPEEGAYKDSNMTAYIAVGVLHYYQITGDTEFLRSMWSTVCKAMVFVTELQGPGGQIYWALTAEDTIDKKALLTGSSSIYFSLTCALKIASLLGEKKTHWEVARIKLVEAIQKKPSLFDQSKSRFSMDWYYPVLCGAVTGHEARERIESSWDKFAVADWGIRCVSDAPWATMAETCELVLALGAMGDFESAEMVFSWIRDKKYEDGAFWTGVTFPDWEIYTTEKTAWTGAAVLLATDMLYGLTPASRFFSHSSWKPLPFSSKLPRHVFGAHQGS